MIELKDLSEDKSEPFGGYLVRNSLDMNKDTFDPKEIEWLALQIYFR